jgi:hypothetical protein
LVFSLLVICRLITPRLSFLFVGEPRRLAAASWAADSAPLSPTNPRPSGRFYRRVDRKLVEFISKTWRLNEVALELKGDADNLRVDPIKSLVFAGFGSGGLAVIDARSRKKVGEIDLKGHSARPAPP